MIIHIIRIQTELVISLWWNKTVLFLRNLRVLFPVLSRGGGGHSCLNGHFISTTGESEHHNVKFHATFSYMNPSLFFIVFCNTLFCGVKPETLTLNGAITVYIMFYFYFGISFSNPDSFSESKHNWYLKGTKTSFKLLKAFYPQAPNIKSYSHLFDQTIKPITFTLGIRVEISSPKGVLTREIFVTPQAR